MFWKILGVIAAVWIAFIVIGAILKLVMPVLIVGALAVIGYVVYKAVSGGSKSDSVGRF